MTTNSDVKTDDGAIVDAIQRRWDTLLSDKARIVRELGGIECGLRACRSAARAFNVSLEEPEKETYGTSTVPAIVIDALRSAGAAGSTVAALRPMVEQAYGADLHPKSIGVALLRMSKRGLVRRERRKWFLA